MEVCEFQRFQLSSSPASPPSPPAAMAASASSASSASSSSASTAAHDIQVCASASAISERVTSIIVAASTVSRSAGAAAFHIVLSGGSLPNILASSFISHSSSIDFSFVHFWFADERCVSYDDKESNYKVCKDILFNRLKNLPDKNIHAIDSSLVSQPDKAAAAYEKEIASHLPSGAFDVVLLGAGPDGHTCSLFPNHSLLNESDKLIASITDSPKPPPSRITFTLKLLNQCKRILFLITGDSKADVIEAIENDRDGKCMLPTAIVSRQNRSKTTLFVDQDAAKKIKSSM